MNKKTILLFLFFPLFIQAQINGQVFSSIDSLPLAYTNIYCGNQIIKTTNKEGKFTLSRNLICNKIDFAVPGFKTKSIQIPSQDTQLSIYLEKISYINSQDIKTVTENQYGFFENYKNKIEYRGFFTNKNVGNYELAMRFESESDFNELLKSISVRTIEKKSKNSPFRLLLYDCLDGKPHRQIIPINQILFGKSEGWVKGENLLKYNVTIPKKFFFVSIEWIDSCKEIKGDECINSSPSIAATNIKFQNTLFERFDGGEWHAYPKGISVNKIRLPLINVTTAIVK